MRHFITLALSFFFYISYGQDFVYPQIRLKGENITDFVPAGWIILDTACGDLNKDQINDAVVIMQYSSSVPMTNSSGDTVLAQPRILVILFKNSRDKGFSLTEQSNSFILEYDNPAIDDPYQELIINNGVIEFEFHLFPNSGSWYVTKATYKFCYRQKQFVLIGADISSFNRATHDYEDHSYNFLTEKRTLSKGNDDNQIKNTVRKTIHISSLKNLETFKRPFTWEIEKGIYL